MSGSRGSEALGTGAIGARVRRAAGRAGARFVALGDAAAARRSRGKQVVADDLTAWSHARGLDVVTVSPPQEWDRRLPTALDGSVEPNFDVRRHARIAERTLVCLPRARVWDASGLLILPDGSFSSQSVYNRARLESLHEFYSPPPWRVIRIPGDSFSLLGPFSNTTNYYHWMHDGLLRLHQVGGHLPSTVKYLVPSTTRPWMVDTLEMLGLGEDRLIRVPKGRAVECERLWYASLPPKSATVPEATAWLRDQLWSAAGVDRPDPRRRLYLSRDPTGHARVVNESELVPVLARYRFEILRPERMSIRDQVRCFSEAEAVISATSSGLGNLVYAGAETKTLELLEPAWAAESAYIVWQLTEAMGQRHWYLTGETVPNPLHPERADLRVPASSMERALNEWLGAAPLH